MRKSVAFYLAEVLKDMGLKRIKVYMTKIVCYEIFIAYYSMAEEAS